MPSRRWTFFIQFYMKIMPQGKKFVMVNKSQIKRSQKVDNIHTHEEYLCC